MKRIKAITSNQGWRCRFKSAIRHPQSALGGVIYALMVLLLLLGLSTGCDKSRKGGKAASAGGEMPDQEMWDSRVILTNQGKRNAVLFAQHITKFEKKHEIKVDGVRVNFFDSRGDSSSILTAKRGRVDEQTNDMEAMDTVVVISRKGAKLETERLWWNNIKEKIVSSVAVKITTDIDTITGVGFESDPNLEHWEIKSNVKGTFKRELPLN